MRNNILLWRLNLFCTFNSLFAHYYPGFTLSSCLGLQNLLKWPSKIWLDISFTLLIFFRKCSFPGHFMCRILWVISKSVQLGLRDCVSNVLAYVFLFYITRKYFQIRNNILILYTYILYSAYKQDKCKRLYNK